LSHLDTQWRWTARESVRDFLPATVDANERLFERFPGYTLSFEGAWRYKLLEETDPAAFAIVRRRVAEGRWFPAGAAVEAFDTLVPSPESVLRQIVYGRRWFASRLGRDSRDLFLPDCFGFPATLPTLACHAGLVGFTTQKLRRGDQLRAARPIPFQYGVWVGPDGSELLAALDPGEYSGRVTGDLSRDPEWIERFRRLAEEEGGDRLLFYVGIGDRGGAVPDGTAEELERSLAGDGPIEVRHGPSEAIYLETSAAERAALPHYRGELLMRLHGTGCYTAKAAMKRWNRLGERLARRAEAALAAAPPYRRATLAPRLEEAWWELLAHQMHDDLTGTSIPGAYRISIPDLGFAVNELLEVAGLAVAAAAPALGGDGPRWILLSSQATPRRECVHVRLEPGEPVPEAIELPDGERVRAQAVEDDDGRPGFVVPVAFDGVEISSIGPSDEPAPTPASSLSVSAARLESDRYVASFDASGRLASLVDRRLDVELLADAVDLEVLPDRSPRYPAWEIRWEDATAAPVGRFDRLVSAQVVEEGPWRVALRIERAGGAGVRSRVRETWRLEEGGELLACDVELDWRDPGRLLKARLPFTVENDDARYDDGLADRRRGLAAPDLYEVPAQLWAALENHRSGHAAIVVGDARPGWDHPAPGVLRSTWIHAPRSYGKFRHQGHQDLGRHRFRFGLGGLAAGRIDEGEAARLADEFVHRSGAWRDPKEGPAGAPRDRTLLTVPPPLRVLAFGPRPSGDAGLQLRVANSGAREAEPDFSGGVAALPARPTDAFEAIVEPLPSVRPSELRTWLLDEPDAPAVDPWRDATALELPVGARIATRRGEPCPGFDGRGRSFPAELLPTEILASAAPFRLGAGPSGATAWRGGGPIDLPEGTTELWLLAASVDGDRTLPIALAGRVERLDVPDWRLPLLEESRWPWGGLAPRPTAGAFRRRPVAWSSRHLRDRRGRNRVLERGLLFALRIAVEGAPRIHVPRAAWLRIVAATATRRPPGRTDDAAPTLLP